MTGPRLDATDREIINALQGGFPICENPFAAAAAGLSMEEDDLIMRIGRLQEQGAISRFGPLYNAERLGGAVTLAAMAVPKDRFDEIADRVNAYDEIAHNYERDHVLNMWFVISVETPQEIDRVIEKIESETDLEVFNMPKQEEFFIGLKVEV